MAERHSVLHVLSYQRRVNVFKKVFFNRDKKTPIGSIQNWWDRCLFLKNIRIYASCPLRPKRGFMQVAWTRPLQKNHQNRSATEGGIAQETRFF